jgi:uncharacterized cupin superfamily protein
VVAHLLAPRTLAAPPHQHSAENELSYVPAGRIGVVLGDHELFASSARS